MKPHSGQFGVPISSKSQREIPVQVVSQQSVYEILNDANENSQNTTPQEQTQQVGETPHEEAPKAAALKEGKVNINELTPVDFDDFMNASIVALPKRLPTMLDVRAKDPNFRLRWVNCKADGGRMVDERKAMGFKIAKREEVVGLEDGSVMLQTDGTIKYHDVILMIVPTRLLFGWYKQNAIDSAAKVAPRALHAAAMEEGNKILRQGIANEGRSFRDVADQIGIFVPGANEVGNK